MGKKEIVIWGAGKIGRGFLADIFNKANYSLNFVDINNQLVDSLNERGQYTIYNLRGKNQEEKVVIKDYKAFCVSEKEKIMKVFEKCNLLALVVFPNAFKETAMQIAQIIKMRSDKGIESPLDIMLCANILHPAMQMEELIMDFLDENEKEYFKTKVGLIETIVIRIAIMPTDEMIKEDPLVVLTNGYPNMPVDETSFKGEKPVASMLSYTSNIRAEETRKMYTYNMTHVVCAYIGSQKGLTYVLDCFEDEEVKSIIEKTLDEVAKGLSSKFGFSDDEMKEWNKQVIKNFSNPILKDKLERVGADPVRKLKRQDRLVGPALICREQGIMPYYLAKVIAGGFLFHNESDPSSKGVQETLKKLGVKEAIVEYTKLDKEPALVQMIVEHFLKALNGLTFNDDDRLVELQKKAYSLGFMYEKTIKGCAQCTLRAFFDIFNKQEPILFQAASGLSGGLAITGDGSCGGYVGGVLYMGTHAGRRMSQIPVDGDKEAQYKSYEMAQKLHDIFYETYGSVTCSDIHKKIFGKAYCLRTKEVRDEFEEAGAHTVKCNSVIANACSWIAKIMYEEGFYKELLEDRGEKDENTSNKAV